MQRALAATVMAALVFGGWHFFQKYRIEGLDNLHVQPRAGNPANGSAGSDDNSFGPTSPVSQVAGSIRIASFNIQVFGRSKLAKPEVMKVLCEVARRFDVLAIQEIRAKEDDILPRFLAQINATGRRYDFVIGPRLGRSSSKEQYAFIYDTATIEADRGALYTVNDADDLLHREPLVGCFRARGPPANEAFTFSLINIHTDPDETTTELDALATVYKAVRNDGRGEDDIILLGDLNVDENHLGKLGQLPNIGWVISGIPTNTRGNKTYDNMVFNRTATGEFTGNAGVLDLVREYGLPQALALEVSDHLPIWAEFNIYEGGQSGRVATLPIRTDRGTSVR